MHQNPALDPAAERRQVDFGPVTRAEEGPVVPGGDPVEPGPAAADGAAAASRPLAGVIAVPEDASVSELEADEAGSN